MARPGRAESVRRYNASPKARAATRRYRAKPGVAEHQNVLRAIRRLEAGIARKQSLIRDLEVALYG